MRIAFVVGEFPNLSVTFIISQITSLIDRGNQVDIYANRPGGTGKVHRSVTTYGLLDRTTYAPTQPRRRLARVGRAARLLLDHPFANLTGRLGVLTSFYKYGNRASWLTLLHRVTTFLPERRYDIIHCHFAPNALVAALARDAGILQGKLLTTFHGYDVNTYARKHGKGIYRRLFQRGDMYTANSMFTTRRAVALGCPADKIVKLPTGVDTRLFSFTERSPDPEGTIRILTVGRLVEVKGIEYGIRAVARVLPDHPNVRYQIVGQGPLLTELKELATKLGVADQVEFLGGQTHDEVRRLYAGAHLFMLPGVVARDGAQEAQGLVLIEAQATGLPVLATRVGGVPESVLDGESGYLVDQGDVDALSAKLGYLIEHPALWPEMGRAGRRFAVEHFDIERLNDRLMDIYHHLLEGNAQQATGHGNRDSTGAG